MKIFLGFLLSAMATGSLLAQDLISMVKRDINAERRTIIAEAMKIPTEKETEFWKVYNGMEKELGILMERRVANINKFAENYDEVTDDVADDLAKTYFDIKAARLKIYKTYYKKFSKVIGKKESSRFFQLMSQIQLIIDMQIAAEVPLLE